MRGPMTGANANAPSAAVTRFETKRPSAVAGTIATAGDGPGADPATTGDGPGATKRRGDSPDLVPRLGATAPSETCPIFIAGRTEKGCGPGGGAQVPGSQRGGPAEPGGRTVRRDDFPGPDDEVGRSPWPRARGKSCPTQHSPTGGGDQTPGMYRGSLSAPRNEGYRGRAAAGGTKARTGGIATAKTRDHARHSGGRLQEGQSGGAPLIDVSGSLTWICVRQGLREPRVDFTWDLKGAPPLWVFCGLLPQDGAPTPSVGL